MARFQQFNKSTGGKTPAMLQAEILRSQIANQGIARENAQIQQTQGLAVDGYNALTDEMGVSPISDGFKGMYDSMGKRGAAGETIQGRDAAMVDPMNMGDGSAISDVTNGDTMGGEFDPQGNWLGGGDAGEMDVYTPEAESVGTGLINEDLNTEFDYGQDDSIRGVLNQEFDALEATDTAEGAIGGVEAIEGTSDLIEGADAVTDIAGATEMVEGVSSAAEAAAAIDSVAGVASNIGLGGVAGALTADSPEEAALTLAMNTNPYTAAALAAFNLLA